MNSEHNIQLCIQCALPVVTIMALWQLLNLGTGCTVTNQTMPRQGTKGAPNWALKQQHCNKFPDGGPVDYLVLTKLTGSETRTFDDRTQSYDLLLR